MSRRVFAWLVPAACGMALLAVVAAGCSSIGDAFGGDGGSPATVTIKTTARINDQGGTVRDEESRAGIIIPRGALNAPLTVQVGVTTSPGLPMDRAEKQIGATGYYFGPDGLIFNEPAIVELPFETFDIPSQSIQNALPANALAYAESLDSAYGDLAGLLGNSEIARQVGEGQTLNSVAQAVIAEALALFEEHIAGLAGSLVGGERLQQVRAALALIQNLEDDFAAHQAERSQVAHGAHQAPFVEGAVRLAAVFDDGKAVGAGDGQDGVHVGRLPRQVGDDDGARPIADALGDRAG